MGDLEHIRTVEHEPYEEGGIKWGKFTSYYRFKKLPLWQRIWIDLQMWWGS